MAATLGPLPCAAAQGRAKATWATEGPRAGRAARLEVQAAEHSDEEEADVIDISQVSLHETDGLALARLACTRHIGLQPVGLQ